MNHPGEQSASGPAALPSGPSWLRRHRLPLAAGGAVLAVGAASASAALVLLARPVATVEKMVPADADVMLVATLDPSVTQKVNLLRALHRFPDTRTDTAVTDAIEKAFKGTGLSFRDDVQPWLGAEVGISAQLNYDRTANSTTAALYALSRDDVKAKAALARLRSSQVGKTLQWRDETYKGFVISVGTPSLASAAPAAYSYIDHVVVIASSNAIIREVIDTEQGRTPRLTDTANYKATMAGLPSDRVGFAYVNGASLVAGIKKQLAKATTISKPIMGSVSDLDAFTGIGATLSATSNGLAADVLLKLDERKLSPASLKSLAGPGRADAVLSWIPRRTDALLAVSNFNRTIETLVDASKTDPSIVAGTDALGLTGPGGVLPHLTGEAAFEAQLGANAAPSGAILLSTDDARSLTTFFNRLLSLGSTAASGTIKSPSTSGKPGLALKTTTLSYGGVVITSLSLAPTAPAALAPAYAVLDGMGILGSNVAAVKAVIDAHQGGQTIAADPSYSDARTASLKNPNALVYANVGSLLQTARQLHVTAAAGGIDDRSLTAVEPVKAIMLTGTSQADRARERLFLLID